MNSPVHSLLLDPQPPIRFATLWSLLYLTALAAAYGQPGTKVWSYLSADPILSSPALSADQQTLYVGSYDQSLHAVNAKDGTIRWTFSVRPPKPNQAAYIYSSPAVGADGTLYFGTDELSFIGGVSSGTFYAVNPNGSLKWKFPTPASIYSDPAIGIDGTIYFGCFDNHLYALRSDGTEKWKFAAGSSIFSDPALGLNGEIYFGCDDHNLYALSPEGSKKWSFDTGGPITASPAVDADGTVYIGATSSKTFFAVHPNGTKRFEHQTAGAIHSSAAIGADGTVYFGSDDGHLYALHPDGSLKWKYTTGGKVQSSPAVAADGTIYVGSHDGNLHAVGPDGQLVWAYQTGSYLYGSPSVGSDGRVYVSSTDHSLYAIDGTSGLASTPWPAFRHDLAHTARTAAPAAAAPIVTTHPASQSIVEGQTVILTVIASGSAPLSYQWRWNGTNLLTQTAASLILTNVTSSQAGTYDVVVSNSAGAIASSPANLIIQPLVGSQPPKFVITGFVDGQIVATCQGRVGRTYELQSCFALSDSWETRNTIGPLPESGSLTIQFPVIETPAFVWRDCAVMPALGRSGSSWRAS